MSDDDLARQAWTALPFDKRFEIWKQHEEVAMHFNDLLLRLRSQAAGGVTVLSTAAAAFASKQEANTVATVPLRPVLVALAAAWTAVWFLDKYYSDLLRGAVRRLLDIEGITPEIRLSSSIEGRMTWRGRYGHRFFYGIIFVTLVGGAYVAGSGDNRTNGADGHGAAERIGLGPPSHSAPLPVVVEPRPRGDAVAVACRDADDAPAKPASLAAIGRAGGTGHPRAHRRAARRGA